MTAPTRRVALGAALGLLAAPVLAQQGFPNRPIRLIVGFGPGGAADILARLLTPKLSAALGQPVVVENRPGAGSVVAMETTARAAPDGHTIMLVSSTMAVTPTLFRSLPYDTLKDFAWIGQLTFMPHVIIAGARSRFRTLGEVLEAARARPGAVNVGAINTGQLEKLKLRSGLNFEIVSYRTTGELLNATIAGELDAAIEVLAPCLPQIRGNALRALAVTTPRQTELLPGIPTAIEAGVPGYVQQSWNGLVGPAAMPRLLVDRWNREVNAILRTPELHAQLIDLAYIPTPTTPEAFGDLVARETEEWSRILAPVAGRG
jgi:tripartite-type tricarboxylate transporter receptor subunit TctC